MDEHRVTGAAGNVGGRVAEGLGRVTASSSCRTISGSAGPASGRPAAHPGPAFVFAGRFSARSRPAGHLADDPGSAGRLDSDCSLVIPLGG
jgi:hypothetical protein